MKKLAILLFTASVSVPALAQHEGHTPLPRPAKEKAKPAQPAPDPNAGHVMPALAPPPTPPAAADPHAGMSCRRRLPRLLRLRPRIRMPGMRYLRQRRRPRTLVSRTTWAPWVRKCPLRR